MNLKGNNFKSQAKNKQRGVPVFLGTVNYLGEMIHHLYGREEKRGARELNGEGFGMRRVVILVILYSRLAESQKEKKHRRAAIKLHS